MGTGRLFDAPNTTAEGRLARRLPADPQAERAVLGAIMLQNHVLDEIAQFLQPEHFFDPRHQIIYRAIRTLYDLSGSEGGSEVQRPIESITVANQLKRDGDFERVGGAQYLAELMGVVHNAAGAVQWARIIRDAWLERELIRACTETLDECYASADDVEQLLSRAERRIFDISEKQDAGSSSHLADILHDVLGQIQQRIDKRSKGEATGISTGLIDLDHMLSGLQPTELIILAARPGVGKTALACNIAENVAAQGLPVLIFSLEMSRLELGERLVCIRSAVNGHRVRKGEISDEEAQALRDAANELSQMPIHVDDTPGRTMSQIAALARRIKRKCGILGLIVVDYLQLIESDERGNVPREQQIASISRRMKFLAKSLNVPVMALAQLNRAVEQRDKKIPRLADLRESGSIEQDADVVMFLHRPDTYDEDAPRGEADVIVAKNRHGPVGTVKLTWQPETLRFLNYAPPEEMVEPRRAGGWS